MQTIGDFFPHECKEVRYVEESQESKCIHWEELFAFFRIDTANHIFVPFL